MYSSSRRRTILILFVSSLLLITLDLRGNAVFDRARTTMSYVLSPFETAGNVIAGPIDRFWAGMTEVDDLRDENQQLRDQFDQVAGERITAQNAINSFRELQELINAETLADIPRVTAGIIGDSASNVDQQVEINRGSNDGIDVGMPVMNAAGVVGRITEVYPESSVVMLVTDVQYRVGVKVIGSPNQSLLDPTVTTTTPSGVTVDDPARKVTVTTTPAPVDDPTTSTTEPDPNNIGAEGPPPLGTTVAPDATEAGNSVTSDPATSDPVTSDPDTKATGDESTTPGVTTTTTIPPIRETGALSGLGGERLPRVSFVQDSPQFGRIKIGDMVLTTGGRESLAPPDIPVGIVRNIVSTGGAQGLQIEVELAANLNRLNYLTVLLYKPPTEVGGG